ncbi:MAG: hypothetical protein H0T45_18600 [Pyrinomonadaceae bacterium]|nr:hypothetical protein [Pyrinomonadaceae bacterium]
MIDHLNLSSKPFRNRVLPWAVSSVVVAVSLVALVLIVTEGRQTRTQADAVERDLRGLRAEAAVLRQRAAEVTQSLTPEQRLTLDAAHDIIDRKKFSWSQLLANLEATLPPGVRVARIGVRNVEQRGGSTRGELELTVVGRAPDDITRMMAGMASTGVFSANLIREGQHTERGEGGTEAMLRVFYTPGAGTISLPPAYRNPGIAEASATATPAAAANSTKTATRVEAR